MKNKENTQEGVFVRHESCEACGSRDNKAVYDNGDKMTYFCFGCEDTGIYKDLFDKVNLVFLKEFSELIKSEKNNNIENREEDFYYKKENDIQQLQ